MAGSHIKKERSFPFHRSNLHDLLHVAVQAPCEDDFSWYDGPDFLDNYHDWNKLLNANDTINSAENIVGANVAKKRTSNYYDQQDQQYIACKYNGGLEHKYNGDLEQVTLELAAGIIVKEEESRFY